MSAMKKILIFAMLAITISLAACGGSDELSQGDFDRVSEQPSEISGSADADGGDATSSDPSVSVPVAPVPTEIYEYVDGRSFSDGVAWVKTSDEIWHLIDKTGKPMMTLGTEGVPWSDFSHGVALVMRADRTIEMIDKDGKVISSPKMGEYDEIHGLIVDIGMILVSKHIVSFEVTETRAGIIDSTGKWYMPLENNPILLKALILGRGTFPLHIEQTPSRYYSAYLGEGVFFDSDGAQLLNIHTGTQWWYGWSSNVSNVENSYVVVAGNEKGWSLLNIKNNSENIIDNPQLVDYMWEIELGEGLFFYRPTDSRGELETQGFFDINGQQVIDLREYDLSYYRDGLTAPVFSDGYCLLLLKNAQETGFYTIIDKTGEFMFEPREGGFYDGTTFSCGLIVYRNYSDGNSVVMKPSGEIVVEIDDVRIHGYQDDVALVVPNQSGSNIYYIDTMGNRLF